MTARSYYNEFEPKAAMALEQLIRDGLIPPGDVDTRSITDVRPDDLDGYTQCHFFAGIGGWCRALDLALWPHERPVWTGSCPCQPFSSAGKQKGGADDRDLWPAWFRLIRECRPATIYGEQVASAIPHGWLDRLYVDMEPEGYALAAAVLPAAGVGADHLRYRLGFVAHAACGSNVLGVPRSDFGALERCDERGHVAISQGIRCRQGCAIPAGSTEGSHPGRHSGFTGAGGGSLDNADRFGRGAVRPYHQAVQMVMIEDPYFICGVKE